MAYRVEFTSGAARQLRKLPKNIQARLAPHLNALADYPRPVGAKKLKGTEGYRLRVGDYRILYEIHDATSRVLVVTVGHRREVSEDFSRSRPTQSSLNPEGSPGLFLGPSPIPGHAGEWVCARSCNSPRLCTLCAPRCATH